MRETDALIAQARALQGGLNEVLDELAKRGVECIGVRDPTRFYPGELITGDRVSLALRFNAPLPNGG